MILKFNRILSVVAIAAGIMLCTTGRAAEIPWSTDIEASLQQAAASGRPVIMEFTADWCGYCKKMEKTTFTNKNVAQRITQNFVPIKVDADQNKELVKSLDIKGLPAILIVSPDLKVIKRISGFQTPDALIPQLDAIMDSRPIQSAPPMIAASQPPQRRAEQPMVSPDYQQPRQPPMRQLPQTQQPQQQPENPFAPITYSASGPAEGELIFEAISQDEAPRVGGPRTQSQASTNSGGNPFLDKPVQRNSPPANNAATDSESFFKSISRGHEAETKSAANGRPAFGGLCIVSATDDRELVNGKSACQINYRGRTLYFSSIDKKEQFLASPATYWPMLDGVCAMTLLDEERQVEGSLEFAAVFRKRIWLFTSQEAMQEFLRNPADVAEEASEMAAGIQR